MADINQQAIIEIEINGQKAKSFGCKLSGFFVFRWEMIANHRRCLCV